MPSRRASEKLRFEASAKLQRLLGRDLLSDDYSAVEELVKNSYDSNATEVTVTIIRPSGTHDGEIEIKDNGSGLSLPEFRRVWMWAGYSEKTAKPLPVTGRVQIGEKGIGRFAADKLGERLTVITKAKGSDRALKVVFEWKRFENQKIRLSDILIPYEHVNEPQLRADQSGTILRIEKLRSSWDDKTIETLRRRLALLLNPYDRDPNFKIVLKAPRPKLSGPVVPSPIKNANFEWEVVRTAEGKTTVRRRTHIIKDEASIWSDWEKLRIDDGGKLSPEEIGQEKKIGPVRGIFHYFVNRPKKVDVGDSIPGVSVFRDGVRVEPAGSSAADWLGLLAKRAKRAGHMPLVPSRLFGFVEISRTENPNLQDATNRRAFIGGPAFDAFTIFLRRRLTELEVQIEKEVAEPRWEKARQIKTQKLIQARYQTLSSLSLGLAHELRQPLQSIHTASENIEDYLKASKVDLPEVNSAVDVIKRNVLRIDKHIQFMKNIGSGKEDVERVRVGEIVAEVLEAFKERAAAQNIRLESHIAKPIEIKFNEWVLLTTITNLVLNAFQAFEERRGAAVHRIDVYAEKDSNGVTIRVEDDGPGIPEEARRRLFRRPTTSKKGGMGVALILFRDALKMFGGELSCTSYLNPTAFVISIPRKLRDGTNTTR